MLGRSERAYFEKGWRFFFLLAPNLGNQPQYLHRKSFMPCGSRCGLAVTWGGTRVGMVEGSE